MAVNARPESRYDATPFIPGSSSLRTLAAASRRCRGCPLHIPATQTVFGEGPRTAAILLVGEQPGDREDLEGRPFVGPAGALLQTALERAGIERSRVFLTNAVKHFKFEARGKKRIHKKPNAAETRACRPWLAAELAAVRPRVIVCLGATARDAVTRMDPGNAEIVDTIHPSAALRAPERAMRHELTSRLARDLRRARRLATAERG